MSSERSAVYDPEALSHLGSLFDQAVAALPAAMRTPANRTEIAKLILGRGVGEPELASALERCTDDGEMIAYTVSTQTLVDAVNSAAARSACVKDELRVMKKGRP